MHSVHIRATTYTVELLVPFRPAVAPPAVPLHAADLRARGSPLFLPFPRRRCCTPLHTAIMASIAHSLDQ